MALRVLLVEPDESSRTEIAEFLRNEGHQAFSIPRLEYIQKTELPYAPDLALVTLTSTSSIPLLAGFKERHPATEIVLMTDRNLTEPETYAVQTGARTYFRKPVGVEDLRRLLSLTSSTIRRRKAQEAVDQPSLNDYSFEQIIGDSEKLQEVIREAKEASLSGDTSVLISGETGTGKELLARAIHGHSSRRDNPFVTVNCAAIPDTLLETELFGYEKGAFTNALQSKTGLFEMADGGTILLDEIGEMNITIQAKLNHFLDDKVFRKVAGTKKVEVDARVVAATNRDLEAEMARGTFREDLYYRLNVVRLDLPPLRERGYDIELLLHHFIEYFSTKLNRPRPLLTPSAVETMKKYSWPGNIRELRNAVERAVLLSKGTSIGVEDIPIPAATSGGSGSEAAVVPENMIEIPEDGLALESVEKEVIQAALRKTNNNVSRAARLLKVGRGSLRYKIKKHRIAA